MTRMYWRTGIGILLVLAIGIAAIGLAVYIKATDTGNERVVKTLEETRVIHMRIQAAPNSTTIASR